MFKKIGSLFHNTTDPLKSLSPEESERIQTFSDILDSLENNFSQESNRLLYFRRVVSGFESTFQNLTPWQSQTEKVGALYSRFVENSLNLLQTIFEKADLYVPLFRCLTLIAKHNNENKLPLSSKFVPFFCQLIKTAKNDQKCLKSSFEFLSVLFKDKSFFDEFQEIDGFSLVFTSFFLTNDKESIDLMLNLLFCVVPPEYYVEISSTTLSICLDALKTEICPKCAIFLVNYISSFASFHVFSLFREDGGYLTLNNFLKLYCEPKDAIECYRIMITKSCVNVSVNINNSPSKLFNSNNSNSNNNNKNILNNVNNCANLILNSLYELFIDSSNELKTSILKYLTNPNFGLSADDINRAIPINEWIIDESTMTDEQIELVAKIMLNISNYNDYISYILTILEKPGVRFEVTDIFLDLLQMLIATNKISIDVLIDKKFMENFILHPTTENFRVFITKHNSIPHLVLALYSSPRCEDYRFTLISKLIKCYSEKLMGLLKNLFNIHFSLEIFNLLLNNLNCTEMLDFIISEIERRPNAFDLFVECDGFKIFNEFLNNSSSIEPISNSYLVSDNENINNEDTFNYSIPVIKALGALARYGPRIKIDEWINALPNDSPFFANNDQLLGSIAVDDSLYLNIPSLLPFVSKFDFLSPLCLFNAGKYGIPMFLKRNIPLKSIPSLDKIANRYAPPSIMKFLLSQVEKMDNFIDINVPQFPIYEFVNNPKYPQPPRLTFKGITNNSPINSIKFNFFIPLITKLNQIPNANNNNINDVNNEKVVILSCPQLVISCLDNIITFHTEKGSASLYSKRGEANSIILTFFAHDVEIKFNGNLIGDRLKTDQGLPYEITFGEPQNNLSIVNEDTTNVNNSNKNEFNSKFYLGRIVYINDQLPRNIESTQNVYNVGYMGFASFFTNMRDTEKLFSTLEETTSIQPYSSLYLSLLHIQKSRNLDPIEFWNRLLLALKRSSSSIIQDNLLLFLHQLPATVYNQEEFTAFLFNVLSDYELYYQNKVTNSNKKSISSSSENNENDLIEIRDNNAQNVENRDIFERSLFSFLTVVETYLTDSTSGVLPHFFIENNFVIYLINIMKSGVSDLIKDKLLSFATLLLSIEYNNNIENISSNSVVDSKHLQDFLNHALTVGDWSLQLPLEIDQFPVHSLIPLSIPESTLQVKFLQSFLTIIEGICNSNSYYIEVFSYQQLLEYSLLFDDYERSSFFLKAITKYSEKNPKFVQHSQLSVFAFSRFANERNCWIEGFSILCAKSNLTNLPKNPTVFRPSFALTLLSMLNRLLSLEAKYVIENMNKENLNSNENNNTNIKSNANNNYNNIILQSNNELVKEVMEIMTRFKSSDFVYFSGSISYLMLLSNFGLVPQSVLNSLTNLTTRQEIEIKIDDVKLTDSEMKSISDGSPIYKHPEILNASFAVEMEKYPFDAKGIEWTKKLPFDDMILFLANVISSFNNTENNINSSSIVFDNNFNDIGFNSKDDNNKDNNFSNVFLQMLNNLSFGSTLMYASYSKYFVTEFVSAIVIQYTQSDTMKLNPLPVAVRIAKCSIFEDNYLHFLSLVVSMMKRKFDPNVIKDFREAILLCFYFITGTQNRQDLEKVFNSYKTIVFHPSVLDDLNFVQFLKLNHVTVSCNPKYLLNYDPIEVEKKWKEYINTNISMTFDSESRNALTNSIINNVKSLLTAGSKSILCGKIKRVCRHYNLTITQSTALNLYLRKIEYYYFRSIKNDIYNKYSKKVNQNSFHLSNLCMPYSSPRVVAHSPFKINSPAKGTKVPSEFFKLYQKNISHNNINDNNNNNNVGGNKIAQVEFFGELQCSPEWFHDQRIFEYSHVLQSKSLLEDFQQIFGKFTDIVQVYLYYFIHPIPCVLFYNNDKLVLLFLATVTQIENSNSGNSNRFFSNSNNNNNSENKKLGLISEPHAPIALIPFDESVLLNEWHTTSLYCGHYVLIFENDRFIKSEPHSYVHQKRSLSFFYLFDPNFILIFDSLTDYETIESKTKSFASVSSSSSSSTITLNNSNLSLNLNSNLINNINNINVNTNISSYNKMKSFLNNSSNNTYFLFNYNVVDCLKLWLDNKISSYDYLLYLNFQAGRSFSDCSQYPVFPWVVSPSSLEDRNLSLPMGQLNAKRAQHYEDTYNESPEPKYYYGCHYSLPGAVFWFMMRLPPFTFFLWDLNEGWDDSQRVFYSMNESYISASSANQTDLKEPIPQIYSVPELFVNDSNLDLENEKEKVILPDWANGSPNLFTEVFRKSLEKSEDLHKWIDLIFGFKQTGENALLSKNLFLPSAYHSSTAEALMIDANAFEDQVINFGQCPKQIFNREHPQRTKMVRNNIRGITQKIVEKQIDLNTFNKNIINSSASYNSSANSSSNSLLNYNNMNSNLNLKNNNVNLLENNNYKLGKNGTVLPEKSVSVPPTYDYFLSVEDLNETTICVRKTENNDLICSITHADFGFITHISISDDGAFICLSFESGFVKVYFLYFELKVPRSLELVARFLPGEIEGCSTSCEKSCLLSQDFLCASLYDKKIIIWNFASCFIHRELNFNEQPNDDTNSKITKDIENENNKDNINNLEYENYGNLFGIIDNTEDNQPVDMFFDSFDGCLTVIFKHKIEQYSINGNKLRSFNFNDESYQNEIEKMYEMDSGSYSSIHDQNQNEGGSRNSSRRSSVNFGPGVVDHEVTCAAFFAYDFTFDGRVILVGNSYGNIDFLVANGQDKLSLIGTKMLFKSKMKEIFVGSMNNRTPNDIYSPNSTMMNQKLWCCDDKSHGNELEIAVFDAATTAASIGIARCKVCFHELDQKCTMCGAVICPQCNGTVCASCKNDMALKATFRLT